jgi:ABC-type sulfate/molybdate transport systems ATPase subunit
LARNARLLLLDEPFASLDGPFRAEFRQQLHLLQRQLAVTMILVTHDQDEVATLADRIVVLEAGRLVQMGTPQEVRDQPASAFAAWLLRSVPSCATPGSSPSEDGTNLGLGSKP